MLDNAEKNFPAKNFLINDLQGGGLKSTLTTIQFKTYEYRINYNYEPWPGRSEFTIEAIRINPQGGVDWIYGINGQEINKVQRSEIGHNLTKWVYFSNNYTPYNTNYVYWNTYERDWNRSPKILGQVEENNTTVYFAGERHHTNEWYGFDPYYLQDQNADMQYIYTYGSKIYSNSKGYLTIHHVEI